MWLIGDWAFIYMYNRSYSKYPIVYCILCLLLLFHYITQKYCLNVNYTNQPFSSISIVLDVKIKCEIFIFKDTRKLLKIWLSKLQNTTTKTLLLGTSNKLNRKYALTGKNRKWLRSLKSSCLYKWLHEWKWSTWSVPFVIITGNIVTFRLSR